jgi:hypothetical protein
MGEAFNLIPRQKDSAGYAGFHIMAFRDGKNHTAVLPYRGIYDTSVRYAMI